MQPTKKMGCPATINVIHIVRFPEYKVKHLILSDQYNTQQHIFDCIWIQNNLKFMKLSNTTLSH